ncbi:TRAP transporter small permease [Mesorhizobium amorphae]|uniref:TRAP transporter small permease n=1 Tax=Mesorhizobium amorphae TaxID=71433 RepID=UPI00118274E7|nr:TRAP transporter small permease [Mesorhizobium amorphae]
MEAQSGSPGRFARVAQQIAAAVAIAGGLLILIVAGLVTTSVIGRWLFSKPIPADYEFVEIGIGVAVFAFLPYTQMRNGHIAVDTFTQRLPVRLNARIDAVWDLVLAAFLGFFAWGLVSGAQESFQYNETMVQISWPIWPVYAICAVLAVVAFLGALAVAVLKFGGRP